MGKRIITNFVSEIDELLMTFDQQHPEKSDSQLREIKKHERVARLRDIADDNSDKWDF